MERLISALAVKTTHFLGDRDIALANWLLDAADNVGIAEGRHVRFSRAIGQREIAEALGVSRETISLRLNEWERAGLLNTGGQSQRFEILDYPRVALRAAVRKNDAPAAIAAALDEIDADLDRGDLVRARNVALDMLTFFPASPELRHRVALAAMRAGAVREAVDVLAQSGYATGGDIDLLSERVTDGPRPSRRRPGTPLLRRRRTGRTRRSRARRLRRACPLWSRTSRPSRRAPARRWPSPPTTPAAGRTMRRSRRASTRPSSPPPAAPMPASMPR